MRTLFFFNWRQKLVSLLLATILWALLKEFWVDPGTLDRLLHSGGR